MGKKDCFLDRHFPAAIACLDIISTPPPPPPRCAPKCAEKRILDLENKSNILTPFPPNQTTSIIKSAWKQKRRFF